MDEMKCPMTFNDPCYDRSEECVPDCAWLVKANTVSRNERCCALAVIASSATDPMGFGPVNFLDDTKGGE